jgi:DtxR family Mn-dependent transcriptional regulator
MDDEKKLSSNMEDYLEAIATLDTEKGFARVKDISGLMNVKNPSVSGALATLEKDDLVRHERYGYVKLTQKGKKIAQRIQKKHRTLRRFLTLILKLSPEIAEADSCRIEHAISAETFDRITKFIEFVETCPEHDTPEWLRNFYYYMKTGERRGCAKVGDSEPVPDSSEGDPIGK